MEYLRFSWLIFASVMVPAPTIAQSAIVAAQSDLVRGMMEGNVRILQLCRNLALPH